MSSPKPQTQQTGPSFESPRPTPRYEQRDDHESRIHAHSLISMIHVNLQEGYRTFTIVAPLSISSFNYVPLASSGDQVHGLIP